MTSKIYDCLVVGGGPAGLTAAATLVRLRRSAVVFDSKAYRNAGAHAMHMVPGFDHADPKDFRKIAREQLLSRYKTIEFQEGNVVSAAQVELGDDTGAAFELRDENGRTWRGKKVILATGSIDVMPEDIEGYKENWPHHIYQCPFCDGLEDSGHSVGILGFPSPMYQTYGFAGLRFDDRVIIFMNGDSPSDEPTFGALRTLEALGARVEKRRVRRIIDNGPGPANGISVELEGGEKVRCGMMFHHPRTVNRANNLFDQLGIERAPVNEAMEIGGEVALKDQFNQTSVKGIFAAGDTTTPYKSVAQAISSGNIAAVGACMTLAMEEGAKALAAKS
ncbi:FAD/NAD(P)-binding domain-containing protein [Rhizodiscina lignyota]|uniref:FAD/NAD(P)-binding domain-containing protein n=1 Tax=Rhizodiscina lignyota TaxID=1504668 RepID=A0A9P4IPX0_9PEZI|nr:FAD/NAD(P)-binding domain-containing protein [Rhizodiscina lignyota]